VNIFYLFWREILSVYSQLPSRSLAVILGTPPQKVTGAPAFGQQLQIKLPSF
jgi:hypothetical protein